MRGMTERGLDRAQISRATASWLIGALVLCVLVLAPPARSESVLLADSHAPGSLDRPTGGLAETGDAHNRTKWKVQVGDTITGTIRDATDSDLAGATQADVVIKSSNVGNTTVRGTKSGSTISFTWHVPAG